MIAWKKSAQEILEELKKHGYTSFTIRKEKVMNESALQGIRTGKFYPAALDAICRITKTQPGKWIKWKPDTETPTADAEKPQNRTKSEK